MAVGDPVASQRWGSRWRWGASRPERKGPKRADSQGQGRGKTMLPSPRPPTPGHQVMRGEGAGMLCLLEERWGARQEGRALATLASGHASLALSVLLCEPAALTCLGGSEEVCTCGVPTTP